MQPKVRERMTRIEAPQENKAKTLARAYFEYLANTTLVGSALVPLWRVTHPREIDQLIYNWRNNVSNALNNHNAKIQTHDEKIERLEEQLLPKMTITEPAIAIGMWIARYSADGLKTNRINVDDVISEFPDMHDYIIRESIAELEDIHLLQWSRTLTGNGFVRPQYTLFWTFDEPALGYRTFQDAMALGNIVLNEPGRSISADKLLRQMNWERRRFNPAFAYLLDRCVEEPHQSQEKQARHPTLSFIIADSDRGRIRRFLRHGGEKRSDLRRTL